MPITQSLSRPIISNSLLMPSKANDAFAPNKEHRPYISAPIGKIRKFQDFILLILLEIIFYELLFPIKFSFFPPDISISRGAFSLHIIFKNRNQRRIP